MTQTVRIVQLGVGKPVGSEAARQNLPEILERAAKGETTVVTKRGRPVAAVVPFESQASSGARGPSILSLRGSGRGLWGKDPSKAITMGRKQWR